MKKVLMIAAVAASAGALSKCKACHTFDVGGKHKTDPNLSGIVGRTMGSTDFKNMVAI